jgi:acyl-CoA reductase-like NAD-dependent aldehyde dehydrogenase
VESAASPLEYVATLPENMRGEVYAQPRGYLSYSGREPYGVVGAIAPWNFPFLLAVWKTAPALAVGNSCVLKMAEQTPLTATLYVEILKDADLPDGVLNVVQGDGSTGAALAAHPRVSKSTFTGSTDVGRSIMAAVASDIRTCHLELGGKTANILLADADLEQATDGSLFTGFFNAGQVCSAGSRLLVDQRVAEVVASLAERAAKLLVGDPFDESTQLGPLISGQQLELVTGFVRRGR